MKKRGGNNIGKLSGEQQCALGRFQRDFQQAVPHMVEMAETAKALHKSLVDAPFWKILEAPKPDETPDQEWTVGHAKVNYVESIKTEGAQ